MAARTTAPSSGRSQPSRLADGLVPIADAASIAAAAPGPALQHDVADGGIEQPLIVPGGLDLDQLTRRADVARTGPGGAAHAHGVLVDDDLPPSVSLALHGVLQERPGVVVE